MKFLLTGYEKGDQLIKCFPQLYYYGMSAFYSRNFHQLGFIAYIQILTKQLIVNKVYFTHYFSNFLLSIVFRKSIFENGYKSRRNCKQYFKNVSQITKF